MDRQRRILLQYLAALTATTAWPSSAPATAVVRGVFGDDYAPWSWGSLQAVQGLAPDLCSSLFQLAFKQNIALSGLPWKRAQYMVEHNEADLMCTAATAARLMYAEASARPIFSTSTGFYLARKSPKFVALSQARSVEELFLHKPRFVTYLGSGWSVEHLGPQDILQATNLFSAIKILAAARADVLLDNKMVIRHTAGLLNLKSDLFESPIEHEAIHFHILIGRNSPCLDLMSRINAIMPQFIASNRYQAIIKKYL